MSIFTEYNAWASSKMSDVDIIEEEEIAAVEEEAVVEYETIRSPNPNNLDSATIALQTLYPDSNSYITAAIGTDVNHGTWTDQAKKHHNWKNDLFYKDSDGISVYDHVLYAAEKTGVDPVLLFSNLEREGFDIYVDELKKGKTIKGPSGFNHLGTDHFGDPKILKYAKKLVPGYFKEGVDGNYSPEKNWNEKGNEVISANFTNMEAGIMANAVMLRRSQDQLKSFLEENKDEDWAKSILNNPESMQYFTFMDYNQGHRGTMNTIKSWSGIDCGGCSNSKDRSNWFLNQGYLNPQDYSKWNNQDKQYQRGFPSYADPGLFAYRSTVGARALTPIFYDTKKVPINKITSISAQPITVAGSQPQQSITIPTNKMGGKVKSYEHGGVHDEQPKYTTKAEIESAFQAGEIKEGDALSLIESLSNVPVENVVKENVVKDDKSNIPVQEDSPFITYTVGKSSPDWLDFSEYEGLREGTTYDYYGKEQTVRPHGLYNKHGALMTFADSVTSSSVPTAFSKSTQENLFDEETGERIYNVGDVQSYMMDYLKGKGAFEDKKSLEGLYKKRVLEQYSDFYPKLLEAAKEQFPNNKKKQQEYIQQNQKRGVAGWGHFSKVNPIITDEIRQSMIDDNIAVEIQKKFGPELIKQYQQRQMEILPGLEEFVYEGGEKKPYADTWAGPATFENMLKYEIQDRSKRARSSVGKSSWPFQGVRFKSSTETGPQELFIGKGGLTNVPLESGAINIQKRGDKVRSYDEGDHVHPHPDENTINSGTSLEDLLELHKSGELDFKQKSQLINLLNKDIETFEANDPSFQRFQFNLANEAAASGTDFYLQSDVKTDVQESGYKRGTMRQGQRTGSGNIITEEGIERRGSEWDIKYQEALAQIQEENSDSEEGLPRWEVDKLLRDKLGVDRDQLEEIRAGQLTSDYTYRGGQLGAYRTTGEEVEIGGSTYTVGATPEQGGSLDVQGLQSAAYASTSVRDRTKIDVAGCGDNMTCITSQTYLMNDAIDAWNAIEGNPQIDLTKQGQGVVTSHPTFWGTGSRAQFGEAGMSNEDRNFLTTIYDKGSFYNPDIENEAGEIIKGSVNPDAVADFFKNMQQGSIMGVHGGGHRGAQSKASAAMPGHAIMYGGGVRYDLGGGKYEGLDFSSAEGYKKSLEFLQNQEDLNLGNIQFLNLQDPTTDKPFQYDFERFGGSMYTEKGDFRVSSFQGNPEYREWYKKTYTDPLLKKQELLSELTTDPKNVNTQLGTDYEVFRGSPDIYSDVKTDVQYLDDRGIKTRNIDLENPVEVEAEEEEEVISTENIGDDWTRRSIPPYEDGDVLMRDKTGENNKLLSLLAKGGKYIPQVSRFGASRALGPFSLLFGSTKAYAPPVVDTETGINRFTGEQEYTPISQGIPESWEVDVNVDDVTRDLSSAMALKVNKKGGYLYNKYSK